MHLQQRLTTTVELSQLAVEAVQIESRRTLGALGAMALTGIAMCVLLAMTWTLVVAGAAVAVFLAGYGWAATLACGIGGMLLGLIIGAATLLALRRRCGYRVSKRLIRDMGALIHDR